MGSPRFIISPKDSGQWNQWNCKLQVPGNLEKNEPSSSLPQNYKVVWEGWPRLHGTQWMLWHWWRLRQQWAEQLVWLWVWGRLNTGWNEGNDVLLSPFVLSARRHIKIDCYGCKRKLRQFSNPWSCILFIWLSDLEASSYQATVQCNLPVIIYVIQHFQWLKWHTTYERFMGAIVNLW